MPTTTERTHTADERTPLPSDKWIRSPKKPGWALCLDPAYAHYGWKLYECNGQWVSGCLLTDDEIMDVLQGEHPALWEHYDKFDALLTHRLNSKVTA